MPRRSKPQAISPYEAIRSCWEAASVAQFFKLFHDKFNFSCLTFKDLEEALVHEESVLIADTCARLLRFLTGNTDILISNFEEHLIATAKSTENRQEVSAFLASLSWNALSAEDKVFTLKWLVDHVFERCSEELRDYLDNSFSADDMRGLCAGQDALNNIYWYMDDLRLYRENSVKKSNRKSWECICVTLEDWLTFLKQFKRTNNCNERALYQYLSSELFPIIEAQLKDIAAAAWQLPSNSDLFRREREDVDAMIKDAAKEKQQREKKAAAASSGNPPSGANNPNSNSNTGNPASNNGATIKMEPSDGPMTPLKEEVGLNGTEDVKPNIIGSTNSGTVPSSSCNDASDSSDLGLDPSDVKPSDSSLQDGSPSCKIPKTEDPNNSHEFGSDLCDSMGLPGGDGPGGPPGSSALSGPMAGPPGPTPPVSGASLEGASVQPLASNVMGKQQPSSMEAQYMQQQSQIFVFSTTLANKSAEAVLQGQYSSIIAYHCSQPGTKKYLEKHPLKMNQFHRQNPAQWLNNLAQMKQKGGPGPMSGPGNKCGNMMGPGGPLGGPGGPMGPGHGASGGPGGPGPFPGMSEMGPLGPMGPGAPGPGGQSCGGPMPMWNQGNNSGVGPMMGPACNMGGPGGGGGGNGGGGGGPMGPGGPIPGPGPRPSGPGQGPPVSGAGPPTPSGVNGPGGPGGDDGDINNPLSGHPSLQGVKVPDENLTPQQRQHREEQLATLRKMQQMLFPEHQGDVKSLMGMPGGPHQLDWQKMQMLLESKKGGGNIGPGMMGPNGPMMGPNAPMMGPNGPGMGQNGPGGPNGPGGSGMGPGGPGMGPNGPGMGPNMGPGPQQMGMMMGGPGGMGMMGPGGGPGGAGGPGPRPSGPRAQGPPPPYHQTPRSASVPIAAPSPTPGSPNNPTSNLSLPSPRTSSGLNSPAEPARPSGSNAPSGRTDSPNASRSHNPSNPGTPVSSTPIHMSPPANRKEESPHTGNNAQPPQQSPDGMFCRTLQSLAQQQQQQQQPGQPGKEPNLMPVPSPQQIQYLNAFEGQELTIQKQPNTSLKESRILSPPLDGGLTDQSGNRDPGTPVTPSFPSTPNDGSRFPVPSPHTPGAPDSKQGRFSGSGADTPSKSGPCPGPCPSPAGPGPGPGSGGDGMGPPRYMGGGGPASSPSPFNQQTPPGKSSGGSGGNFMDVSSPGKDGSPCSRPDNMPLNPNTNTTTSSAGNKGSLFDPISSLAQMSQQLANNVSGSPGSVGMPNQGMMPFNSPPMHMMGMNDMGMPDGLGPMDGNMPGIPNTFSPNSGMGHPMSQGSNPGSPKPRGPSPYPNMPVGPMPGGPMAGGPMSQRMMSRPPGPGPNPFNGANVQVKASAPNTIQYLPARPQAAGHSGPRGPPSLDFLQRFANPSNPLQNLDSKVPTHNLQYYPNSSSAPSTPTSCGPPMGGMGSMNGGSPQMVSCGMNMGPNLGMGPNGGNSGPNMSPGMGGVMGPSGGNSASSGQSGPNVSVSGVSGQPGAPIASGPSASSAGGPNGPLCGGGPMPSGGGGMGPGPGGMMGMGGPNSMSMGGMGMGGPNMGMRPGAPMMGVGPVGGPGMNPGSMGMGPGNPLNAGNPNMGPNNSVMGPNNPNLGPGGPGMGPGSHGMGPGNMGPGNAGMGLGGPNMGPGNSGMMGGGPGMMPGGPGGPGMCPSGPMGPGMVPGMGPRGPGPGRPGMGPCMMRMPGMPLYPGQPGPNPDQMFVPGSKGSPMDASQPLPPSNYKNSSFIGPTTADPNYAQQFHNFQQQLYATNTRSANQSFFLPK